MSSANTFASGSEIERALHIPEAEVIELLQHRPGHVDVILTGPNMPDRLLDSADQITQIRRSRRP